MDWKLLREGLSRMRNESGLTLDELASASGIDRSTIHRIENVKKRIKHNPDLETIERLVIGAGGTLSWFFRQLEVTAQSQLDSGQTPREQVVGGDQEATPVSAATQLAALEQKIQDLETQQQWLVEAWDAHQGELGAHRGHAADSRPRISQLDPDVRAHRPHDPARQTARQSPTKRAKTRKR